MSLFDIIEELHIMVKKMSYVANLLKKYVDDILLVLPTFSS